MNLHPRHQHCDIVQGSGRKPRVNIQSCVGYQVCFGTRGVVFCKSHDVEMVPDAGSVFNSGRKDNGGVGRQRKGNGGVGGKRGYIYSSFCDLIHILHIVG